MLVEYFDPAPIDRRLMTAQEVEHANKKLSEEAWFDEIEYYEEMKEKEMGRSEREDRQKRKQERVDRDKEGHGYSGSYALGKHGFDFEFHKPDKSTTMKIHILPFLIKSDRHPEVAAGRMEIGDEDYFLEYAAHRGIGPDGKSAVLCLDSTYGKPCPICEFVEQLRNSKSVADQNKAGEWKARRRHIMWVVDRNDREAKAQPFESAGDIFDTLAAIYADPEFGDITDIDTGRDYLVKREGTGGKFDTHYKAEVRPNACALSNDENVVLKLFSQVKPYEEMAQLKSEEDLIALLSPGSNPDDQAIAEVEGEAGAEAAPAEAPPAAPVAPAAPRKLIIPVRPAATAAVSPAAPAAAGSLKERLARLAGK